jgi:hypothetical protein
MPEPIDAAFTQPLPRITPEHLRRIEAPASEPVFDRSTNWGLFELPSRRLEVFDAGGALVREASFPSLPVPRGVRGGQPTAFALDPDPMLAVLLGRDRLTVCSETGTVLEHAHTPWGANLGGAAAFVDGGKELWVAHPDRTGTIQIESGRLTRLRLPDGEVLDSVPLDDSYPESYGMISHPTEPGVLLSGSYGQDGSSIWTALADGTSLAVTALPAQDKAAGSFDPSGERFVAGPHDVEDISVFAWPDGEEIARLDGTELFDQEPEETEPDGFFYQAVFVDEARIAAQTFHGRLVLLQTDSLGGAQLVVLDGYEVGEEWGDGDLMWINAIAPGVVLTHHGAGHVDLWRL